MNENKEMTKRVKINISDAISEVFPEYLVKDLTEHERICPECHGLGMKIVDNVYGLNGDTSEAGKSKMFPYKHQSLSFCQSCFNGVQRLCPYCGQPWKNQAYFHCECDGFKAHENKEQIKKWDEKTANAREISEAEVKTMLYCDEFDKYYDTVDEFFEEYACEYDNRENHLKPDKLWVCRVQEISIDAADVIENACEELHDDAAENCDEKSLQQLLDDWCEEQSGATTYYPDYTQYVEIDWSEYEAEATKHELGK